MRTDDLRVRLANSEEAAEIDRLSQIEGGISGKELMEMAGRQTFRFIESKILPFLPVDNITIFVGLGNNGGDALVVAKELAKKGFTGLNLFIFEDPESEKLSELQKEQWEGVDRFDFDIQIFDGSDEQKRIVETSSLIIDGIFGVGLNRKIEGLFEVAIEWINDALEPVLSIDTPSGLNVNTGRVMGVAVEAQWTVTFGLAKPGFYIWDGPRVSGDLHIFFIGFPEEIVQSVASSTVLFDLKTAHETLPQRADTSNKSTHGRVNVFAGKEGMWGAAMLSCKGAFRAGAGYVKLCNQDDLSVFVDELPDLLTQKYNNVSEIDLQGVYLVGPGFGVGPRCESVIRYLLESKAEKVVIDADGISTMATCRFDKLPDTWVMTPHSGELARLLGMTSDEVDADRINAANIARDKFGLQVLLKGYKTLLATEDRVSIINSGNSALATAGTGDVLSGLIAGFMAQGLSTEDSASVASFLHGTVADLWVKKGKAKNSLMASDILDLLPESFQWILSSYEEG